MMEKTMKRDVQTPEDVKALMADILDGASVALGEIKPPEMPQVEALQNKPATKPADYQDPSPEDAEKSKSVSPVVKQMLGRMMAGDKISHTGYRLAIAGEITPDEAVRRVNDGEEVGAVTSIKQIQDQEARLLRANEIATEANLPEISVQIEKAEKKKRKPKKATPKAAEPADPNVKVKEGCYTLFRFTVEAPEGQRVGFVDGNRSAMLDALYEVDKADGFDNDVKAYRGDLDKPLGRAVIWYNSEYTRTSQDGWIPKEEARKSLKPKKGKKG